MASGKKWIEQAPKSTVKASRTTPLLPLIIVDPKPGHQQSVPYDHPWASFSLLNNQYNDTHVKLTAEFSNEYVPSAQEIISSLVMDGHSKPAGQTAHTPQPNGLYVPNIHNEVMVGGCETSGQE